MTPLMLMETDGAEPADDWVRVGNALYSQKNLPQARELFCKALLVAPSHATAMNNLAVATAYINNNWADAKTMIDRAVLFAGTRAKIWENRAFISHEVGAYQDALDSCDAALAIVRNAGTCHTAAMIYGAAGYIDKSHALYHESLKYDPNNIRVAANLCFGLSLMDVTPEYMMEPRKFWYEKNGFKGTKIAPSPLAQPPHNRPLRVGYIGGDFRAHSASMIFSAVCLHHDRTRVEPFFYSSYTPDPNGWETQQFIKCGNWRVIDDLDDAKAAELIRADRLDILVDLAAHTAFGRLGVMTHKPAPIQATAWGFAHGTGIPEIDYFLADPVSVPESEREFYTEKIWDLPCIVTYEPHKYKLKKSSRLPFFKNGHITFGCFCRYEKVSEKYLKMVEEILNAVPQSVIYFKDTSFRMAYTVKRVRSMMPSISEDRIHFGTMSSHTEHVRATQDVDLMLDPTPHTGGAQSLEQLYMGVPIVTLYGCNTAGRVTSSILTAMDRTEWIAKTPEEYVQKAVDLVSRPEELQQVRAILRMELMGSPVCKDYVTQVEQAYRSMCCDKKTERESLARAS